MALLDFRGSKQPSLTERRPEPETTVPPADEAAHRAADVELFQRELSGVADVLEHELTDAVAEIQTKSKLLTEGAQRIAELAENVGKLADEVTGLVNEAAAEIDLVAGATVKLEASSGQIADQATHSGQITQSARAEVDKAKSTVGELSKAAEQIHNVVKLINTIAGQTKMLALNATIEAARAGEAGRGFAVVATEVKGLARQTEDAISKISAEARSIESASGAAVANVGAIAERIGTVDAAVATVSQSASDQKEATADIMRSATGVSGKTREVAARVANLNEDAVSVRETIGRFRHVVQGVDAAISDLSRRVSVILRSSTVGNRRRSERHPMAVGFRLSGSGITVSGETADLSAGGALLLGKMEKRPDAALRIELDAIGASECVVTTISVMGIHVEFMRASEAFSAGVARRIEESKQADARQIVQARSVAHEIEQVFERALSARQIEETALFDTAYREIPGTDPVQFLTRSTEFIEKTTSAILDRAKDADARFAFVILCDVNGYLPTHNRDARQPQKPGDVAWNTAHARNRRIFDDRTGLLAARNTKESIVQSYRRDMGGGKFLMLKEFDVPVNVRGRHWGGLRWAVKL